jgi:hypothetical protein
VRAENTEMLHASYSELATVLGLPEQHAQEQMVLLQAVRRWLSTQQGWLLILDNADEPDVLAPFLPPTPGGHILLTTRASALRRLGIVNPLTVDTFTPKRVHSSCYVGQACWLPMRCSPRHLPRSARWRERSVRNSVDCPWPSIKPGRIWKPPGRVWLRISNTTSSIGRNC